MNNPKFVNGEYYHVYNRGTDKRTTFMDTLDYRRFMDDLRYFNCPDASVNARTRTGAFDTPEVEPRQPIIEIAAYCLMPNHFHLLVRQLVDGGVSLFMKKLGTGYTMYFNKRNSRSGALFQRRYKAKHVADQQYLVHLVHYIHANPIAHTATAEVEPRRELSAMDAYPWSSWGAYCGRGSSGIDLQTRHIFELLGETDYRDDLASWLCSRDELSRDEQSLRTD